MQPRAIWRSFKTPLTLLALLAFVLAVGAWAYNAATAPVPKPPPSPCVTKSVGAQFTASDAYIRIYNGTSTGGLAKNTKLVFGSAGFHVLRAVNAPAAVEKTYVAGVSADSPEVKLVMSYFPKGTPFTADPVKYADHAVDIYLGKDFSRSKLSKKPLTSVPVAGGQACVPNVTSVAGGS